MQYGVGWLLLLRDALPSSQSFNIARHFSAKPENAIKRERIAGIEKICFCSRVLNKFTARILFYSLILLFAGREKVYFDFIEPSHPVIPRGANFPVAHGGTKKNDTRNERKRERGCKSPVWPRAKVYTLAYESTRLCNVVFIHS